MPANVSENQFHEHRESCRIVTAAIYEHLNWGRLRESQRFWTSVYSRIDLIERGQYYSGIMVFPVIVGSPMEEPQAIRDRRGIESLRYAAARLENCFRWSETQEGVDFWNYIRVRIINICDLAEQHLNERDRFDSQRQQMPSALQEHVWMSTTRISLDEELAIPAFRIRPPRETSREQQPPKEEKPRSKKPEWYGKSRHGT